MTRILLPSHLFSLLLILSCASSRKEYELFNCIENDAITVKLIPFDTLYDGQENIRVDFEIRNNINDTICILDPTSFGCVVYPFMRDTYGNNLQIKFRIKALCDKEPIIIAPNMTKSFRFPYDLSDCFFISTNCEYVFWLVVSTPIDNVKKKTVCPSHEYKSNEIKLVLLKRN